MAQAARRRFATDGGRTIVCGIAMDRPTIARDNVIDCATVERNVFVSSVELQNHYAYMPIA